MVNTFHQSIDVKIAVDTMIFNVSHSLGAEGEGCGGDGGGQTQPLDDLLLSWLFIYVSIVADNQYNFRPATASCWWPPPGRPWPPPGCTARTGQVLAWPWWAAGWWGFLASAWTQTIHPGTPSSSGCRQSRRAAIKLHTVVKICKLMSLCIYLESFHLEI